MRWIIFIMITAGCKMVFSKDVNLMSPKYLSVWQNCYSPFYTWFQTNQTSLQNDQLRLQCDRDFWGDSEPQKCNDIRLSAESSKEYPSLYGTLEFVAKLPVDGFSSGGLNLVSMNCQEYPCSMPIRGSTAGFSFWKVNPRITSCFVYYVDARSSSRVWLDIRDYTWPTAIDPTSFRTYQFVWTAQYFACLVDGTVIANFTNQLSIPKETLFTRFLVNCDNEAPSRTAMDDYELQFTNVTYSEPLDQDNWNGSQQHSSPPVGTWMEHWEGHVQLLTLYAYDDDIAVYFDEILSQKRGDDDMPVNGWLFEYVGQVWRYADQQFGPLYQGNDSRFYTVFHVGRYNGCHIATQMEASHDFHHVLDCGSSSRTMWNTNTTSSTTNISWAVSHIGIRYARGVLGHPMWSIDQSALEHIVRYDICLGVNHPEVAQIVLDEFLDSPQTSPRAKSYWLRDFYLPVYNSYGNTTVLANYFSLLSTNFPTFVNDDGSRRYNNATITVTLGLYVHFWSGAANNSLQFMAAKAFGWTAQDSNDFRQAQKDFPRIRYAGEYDDILTTPNRRLSVSLGISIPVVAVALTVSAVACWWYRKKKRGQRIQAVSLRSLVSNSKECQCGRDTGFTDTDTALNGGKNSGFVISKDVNLFVVPRKKLQQSNVILGKGEFGTVYAATASRLYGLVGKVPVAAKVLKYRLNADDVGQRSLFEKEVHIMIKGGKHLNLVNLLGIVLDEVNGHPTLLLELCELGSLQSRLVNCRLRPETFVDQLDEESNMTPIPLARWVSVSETGKEVTSSALELLSTSDLVDFSYQVCRGLEFLSSKNIVHKDIAARNVLLTKDKTAKVSGFGMARFYEKISVQETNGQSAQLAIRWMAPEAIASLSFNQCSDVWSYGVLLWEMFSLGLAPYGQMALTGRVAQFGEWLAAGQHLDKPLHCPNHMYRIMQSCWTVSTIERPTFQELRRNLEDITAADIAGYYTRLDEPYERYNLIATQLSDNDSIAMDETLLDCP